MEGLVILAQAGTNMEMKWVGRAANIDDARRKMEAWAKERWGRRRARHLYRRVSDCVHDVRRSGQARRPTQALSERRDRARPA